MGTPVTFIAGDTKEIHPARRQRFRRATDGLHAGRRHGGRTRGSHQVGIDESGVNGEARRIPDARISRRLNALAHCFDQPVANHHGSSVDDLARLDHDTSPDQGVNAQRQRTMTRRKKITSHNHGRQRHDSQKMQRGSQVEERTDHDEADVTRFQPRGKPFPSKIVI